MSMSISKIKINIKIRGQKSKIFLITEMSIVIDFFKANGSGTFLLSIFLLSSRAAFPSHEQSELTKQSGLISLLRLQIYEIRIFEII
jgi:hypothetical protein